MARTPAEPLVFSESAAVYHRIDARRDRQRI
jgi:hypothetical protein